MENIRKGQIVFVDDQPSVVTWADNLGFTCKEVYGHEVDRLEHTFYYGEAGEVLDLLGDNHTLEY